jgi:uncharacterized protein (TIGR02246 family)
MTHRTAKLALPLLLALGAAARDGAAQVGGAPAQPPAAARQVDAAAEERTIRELSQKWLAAHKARDAGTVIGGFADDAVAVYDATLLTGRDAIRRHIEEGYAKAAKERPDFAPSWQTTAVRVAQAGDMAYETGTWEDTWNAGANRERGYFLTVWRKVGGQWKVAHDMAVAAPDSAAARKPTP